MPDDAHRVHGSRMRRCQSYRVLVRKRMFPLRKAFFPAPQQLSAHHFHILANEWEAISAPARGKLPQFQATTPIGNPKISLSVALRSVAQSLKAHRPEDGVFAMPPGNCQQHEVRCTPSCTAPPPRPFGAKTRSASGDTHGRAKLYKRDGPSPPSTVSFLIITQQHNNQHLQPFHFSFFFPLWIS